MEKYTIKEVAKKTGIPESTIRYYDKQFGRFFYINRDNRGKRIFTDDDIKKLVYIRSLIKDDGLSLKQVKNKLALESKIGGEIKQNQKVIEETILNMDKRIKQLERKIDLIMVSLNMLFKMQLEGKKEIIKENKDKNNEFKFKDI